MDLYFTDEGDISLSPTGDIALTDTPWRDDLQQAYIRMLTEEGDYLLYPNLGATLSKLYGLPQSVQTGNYGEELIRQALAREGRFTGRTYTVKAVPTGYQTIRFDVTIVSSVNEQIKLSVEQSLVE